MVYVSCLVSIDAAVDVQVRGQLADSLTFRPIHPADCLFASNLFADVFGYAAAFQKSDCRETTQAVDW